MFDAEKDLVLSRISQDIGRGHAEVLMGIIGDVLSKASITYKDLSRIGVTIGPGSFTGVRVGMSVARGLGMSLKIPVLGVSTLDACEAQARELGYEGLLLSLLDAKRGELYCKISDQEACAVSYDEALQLILELKPTLCGAGAVILNQACNEEFPIVHQLSAPEINIVAELASRLSETSVPPEPLYLRSADAKVQAGFALERA